LKASKSSETVTYYRFTTWRHNPENINLSIKVDLREALGR